MQLNAEDYAAIWLTLKLAGVTTVLLMLDWNALEPTPLACATICNVALAPLARLPTLQTPVAD